MTNRRPHGLFKCRRYACFCAAAPGWGPSGAPGARSGGARTAGARTTGARAALRSVCFELGVDALDRLGRDRPGILLQLHTNVGRSLATRVGQLSDEVLALG